MSDPTKADEQPNMQRGGHAVRAKFSCFHKDTGSSGQVRFCAVVDNTKDNASWSEATPSGYLDMNVSNEAAFERFEVGQSYYIDFTPCD